MTRWDRKGFAALTGFREVNEGYAPPARGIERRENTHQRSSSLTGALPLRPEPLFAWGVRSAVTSSGANRRMKPPKSCDAAPRLLFARERRTLRRVHPAVFEGKSEKGRGRHNRNAVRQVVAFRGVANEPSPENMQSPNGLATRMPCMTFVSLL